jgi:hypothetical protein
MSPLSWLRYRAADFEFSPPRWLAWASVATVLAVYVFVAWTNLGPLFAADEISMVGEANVIAHASTTWTLAGSGYMPGLAILLAPAWWFTNDSFLVYHIGLGLGVALSVLTIWPLSSIARNFGIVSRPGAVIIASVVMLLPARTVPANYVIAESLLTLCTAAAFAMAYSFARNPTVRHSALLGVMVGLAFLAHGRAIALVVAAGLWIVLVAGRRWRLSIAFIASSGMVTAGAWLLFRFVTSELFWHDTRLQSTFSGVSRLDPGALASATAGMAWYAMTAWPAMAIIGVAVIIKRSRLGRSPESLMVIALILATAIALVQLHFDAQQSQPRLDIWIYGRYLDHLLTVVAVMGLAVLVRVRHRAIPAVVLVASAIIGFAFVLDTVPRIPVGGSWTDVHVAGASPMLSLANLDAGVAEPWVLITCSAVGIGVLFALLGWLRFSLPVLAVFALALSLATDSTRVDARDATKRLPRAINVELLLVPADEKVGFSADYATQINAFVFAEYPRTISIVTLPEAARHYSTFFTSYNDTAPAKYGAKRLFSPISFYSTMVWVFPGPLFDDLSARGMLLDNQG